MPTKKKTVRKSTKRDISRKPAAVKSSAPDLDWSKLTHEQKVAVWRRMFRTYRRVTKFAAGRYNIVGSTNQKRLRDRAQIEMKGEDDALTQVLRDQFINLGRNGVRNNETLNAVLLQFKLNVIGTVGGKAYFDFPDEFKDAEKVLRREFKKHCRSCEFHDGMKFGEFLEHVLVTVAIGGDVVVAFDNHTFEDSGKIIGYEPDCIANLDEKEFAKSFGKGETQRQGRIYTKSGRFCGVVVSSAERGLATFSDMKSVHVFEKDPNADRMDCDWIMLGHRWRFNQGRGTPPLAAPLGSFLDVDVLQGFEIEAGKLNAQMCAQVYQTGTDGSADEKPTKSPDLAATEFDEQTAADVDAAAEEAAADEFDDEDEPPKFQELESAGVVWNLMPADSKMELLDTKHPNPNMNEFIRIVSGRGGWAMGVASVYTCGKVDSSYTGYRGEQIMTWPAFEKWQKFLEDLCDWHFRRWFAWASKFNPAVKAIADNVPDDLFEIVRWTWPIMREVNAVDAQTAWNLGLKNGTIGYADILGPDWKEKLEARGKEREWCRAHDFPHPADETVSGQIREDIAGNNKPDNGGKENEDE